MTSAASGSSAHTGKLYAKRSNSRLLTELERGRVVTEVPASTTYQADRGQASKRDKQKAPRRSARTTFRKAASTSGAAPVRTWKPPSGSCSRPHCQMA